MSDGMNSLVRTEGGTALRHVFLHDVKDDQDDANSEYCERKAVRPVRRLWLQTARVSKNTLER